MKKTGLGRSLNSLLSNSTVVKKDAVAKGELRRIPLDVVERSPYQPRRIMDDEALQSLSASIKQQGVLQPIVVREVGEKFQLIAGERRWRASALAGLANIPAIINNVSDDVAMTIALVENIQRENLNPIEEAMALQRIIDSCGFTHEELAETVGKSRTTVTNVLRLLKLAEPVKRLLDHGDLEMGHARALLSLPQELQQQAAEQIVAQGLSVRQTESLVRRLLESPVTVKRKEVVDPNIKQFQNNLSDKLSAKVIIKHQQAGKGQLVIYYNSLEDLDGIVERMG